MTGFAPIILESATKSICVKFRGFLARPLLLKNLLHQRSNDIIIQSPAFALPKIVSNLDRSRLTIGGC